VKGHGPKRRPYSRAGVAGSLRRGAVSKRGVVLEGKSVKEVAAQHLRIVDKEGTERALDFNACQRVLVSALEDQEKREGYIRAIEIKPRQIGSSTAIEAFCFLRTVARPNYRTQVIAHDRDTTRYLFNMAREFYRCLPDDKRPQTRYSGKDTLDFSAPEDCPSEQLSQWLGGWMRCQTVGGDIVGHGRTLGAVHGSEVAYWELVANTGEVMKGIMNSIKFRGKGTAVILETTGRGTSGLAYDMYQAAKKGKGDFIPIFFPWMLHEEYRIAGHGLKRSDLTPAEQKVTGEVIVGDTRKMMRPTLSAIAWRRAMIEEMRARTSGGLDPEDEFRQQYPATDDEAFQSEGANVFDINIIRYHTRRARELPPPKRVFLVGMQKPSVEKHTSGGACPLLVWKDPEPGMDYVLGVDVASSAGPRSDYSCVVVLAARTLAQVACWHGRVDPDELAVEAARLGFYYNCGTIGVEVNSRGLMTARSLADRVYYPNLYHRRKLDEYTGKWKQDLGWYTSRRTKSLLIDDLVGALREKETTPRDLSFLEECRVLVRDPKGSVMCPSGNHDDRVIAYGIALQVQRAVGEGRDPEEEKERQKAKVTEMLRQMFTRRAPEGYDDVIGTEW
jgi:hypothetical protein